MLGLGLTVRSQAQTHRSMNGVTDDRKHNA